MEMMAVWAAVLIVYGVFPGTAAQRDAPANSVYDLDMAVNSVDDMYDGCEKEMSEMAKKYLTEEKEKNQNLTVAWKKGEDFYNYMSQDLGKEQIIALHAYTSELKPGPLYKYFNEAVRSQGPQYKTTFRYHALHFYLTDALQALRKNCITSFRGTNRNFNQNVLNREIRFGLFASSSKNLEVAILFGTTSCFDIYTCYGAEIENSSAFKIEEEVLIPPYEVFKVTDIKYKSQDKSLPCQVVYKVESTGIHSNLNCAFNKAGSEFNSLTKYLPNTLLILLLSQTV